MRVFYVYVLFRPWDGSPFYVGKGKGTRWARRGSSRNPYFRNIVQKAERLGVEIPKIKVRQGLTEAEAFETEISLIAAIGRSPNGPLVNMTDGGDGVANLSAESRQKISHTTKARMADPVARAKQSRQATERQSSEEIRMAARELMLRLQRDPIIGPKLLGARKGTKLSEQTKELIRVKAIQRMEDPKRREYMSAIARRQTKTAASLEKQRIGMLAYWEKRRQAGLPMCHRARDEKARRAAISKTMKMLRAHQRAERRGHEV